MNIWFALGAPGGGEAVFGIFELETPTMSRDDIEDTVVVHLRKELYGLTEDEKAAYPRDQLIGKCWGGCVYDRDPDIKPRADPIYVFKGCGEYWESELDDFIDLDEGLAQLDKEHQTGWEADNVVFLRSDADMKTWSAMKARRARQAA